METLFIADLHLTDEQPDIYQRFSDFLSQYAQDAEALYILGDLFEYYLGDDALSTVAQQVAKDLFELQQHHQTQCYFMAGNRDFLLGQTYADMAGLTLLPQNTLITLDNEQPLLLTHGDELCTDDVQYQTIRKQLRSPQWQQWFLNQSIDERIAFAQDARKKSQQHTQQATAEIMDVNAEAVIKAFTNHQCQLMLHGHTHRPAFHHYKEPDRQRMVLGDWHHQTSFMRYSQQRFELINH